MCGIYIYVVCTHYIHSISIYMFDIRPLYNNNITLVNTIRDGAWSVRRYFLHRPSDHIIYIYIDRDCTLGLPTHTHTSLLFVVRRACNAAATEISLRPGRFFFSASSDAISLNLALDSVVSLCLSVFGTHTHTRSYSVTRIGFDS